MARLDAAAAGEQAQPHYRPSTWASLVRAPDVRWDWPGWLSRGFLTIVASEPGVGKSALCLTIAASYIDGRPWPDGADFTAEPGQVLWIESEGSYILNRERALRWRLDLDQIICPLDNPMQSVRLDNEEHVDALLAQARQDAVRLVVIDSLNGLHAHGSKAREVDKAVVLLADFARAIQKPVLLTHHLRHSATFDQNGRLNLDRMLGSSVIAQVPRVVWALDVPDPAEPEDRRLSVIKNNLASFPDPIGFRIETEGLHFGPLSQSLLVNQSEEDRAVDFLKDLLARGPRPVTYVLAEASAVSISEPTLKRAKKRLRVKSNKLPDEWYWELPIE